MSIREYSKDQLSKHTGVELAPSLPLQAPAQEDPLVFWTEHPSENTLVDLRGFRDGVYETPRCSKWNGPYTGRPGLITQLAPAVEASLTGLAKQSVDAYLISLRAWWRVLDAVEAAAEQASQPMDRVEDVRQLTEVHRQWTYEHGMQRKSFRFFVAQANHVLALLRAPQLHWISPESAQPKRYLPPEKHLKVLRIALKQEWLKAHDRWRKADRLLSGEIEAATEGDIDLLRHYRYYEVMRQKIGKALLTAEEIADDTPKTSFATRTGLSTRTMKDGFFPNRWDIDAAFCQCLAVTGWNPSTLLGLDATKKFLRTHPKDAKRFMLTPGEGSNGDSYELTGTKRRAGDAEQRLFGLWKTRFGAGYVLNMLLERTAPMRAQLKQACDVEKARYAHMQEAGASTEGLTAQFKNVQRLEAGCHSVWLYQGSRGIAWLGISPHGQIDGQGKQTHYLDALTQRLNAGRAGDDQIETLTLSDLRDAFALWVWRATGGNILAVMKALQHRWIQSTVRYVNNNIINAESNAQYRTFSNHLFGELVEGRLDVTILTHLCRYGQPSEEMMARLDEYRALMRSRCKVACKDPHNPPKHIAPAFVADGKRVCPTQRCLLCKQHAVFLPESIDGVAMRVEELLALEERMPMQSWLTSLYQMELDNALIALKLFALETVRQRRSHWAAAIAAGSHRVPGLALLNDGEESTA